MSLAEHDGAKDGVPHESVSKAIRAMSAKERLVSKAIRAPPLDGSGDPMTYSGPGFARACFEELAGKGKSVLKVEDARTWLRCIGWTLPDSELDQILLTPSHGTWTLQDLIDKNAKNQGKKNGDKEMLVRALKKLSHGKSSIAKEDLQKLIVAEGSLSKEEFQKLMKVAGLEKDRVVNCEVLVQAFFSKICQPPQPLDLAALGWSREAK
jgi:hypothetical protein